jgi:hypothetical protein
MALPPFFSYYGSKSKIAHLYPSPKYSTIVEPFAGAANYALRHHHRDVILVEKYDKVYSLWKWLIEDATQAKIQSIPLDIGGGVESLDICEGAKLLLGWVYNQGVTSPRKSPSAWMRKRPRRFWNAQIRSRLATQLHQIKHWRLFHGDFSIASSLIKQEATWFIDPPYHKSGFYYPESSKKIDFDALGDWCQSLKGQVIVCEQEGADWLPFQPLCTITRDGLMGPQKSKEVVWLSDGNYRKQLKGFGL